MNGQKYKKADKSPSLRKLSIPPSPVSSVTPSKHIEPGETTSTSDASEASTESLLSESFEEALPVLEESSQGVLAKVPISRNEAPLPPGAEELFPSGLKDFSGALQKACDSDKRKDKTIVLSKYATCKKTCLQTETSEKSKCKRKCAVNAFFT